MVSIHAIGGMAGVGKTAFAVHAAHQLADRFPGRADLPAAARAHPGPAAGGPGRRAGQPAADHRGRRPGRSRPELEARAALWRDRLAGKQLLLVLDDAAEQRAGAPLLPGAGGSLVLVTSRRHLTALEDATAISLDTLPPGEAPALLVRLAARPGLSPDDAAVSEIARLCGYLPLAIGMLARQLHHHPAWTVAGRAAELAAARDRLELMATENLSVAAAFDLSYDDLAPDQQRLFRRLGAAPGHRIEAYAAAALDGTGLARRPPGPGGPVRPVPADRARPGPVPDARPDPRARPRPGRPPRPRATTGSRPGGRLLDYYQHTAARAEALLARRPPCPGLRRSAPRRTELPVLDGREQALAWARAERASLLACLDHAAATGQHARVIALTAAWPGCCATTARGPRRSPATPPRCGPPGSSATGSARPTPSPTSGTCGG